MLVEFTVANFRSIKMEQSFSLVKGKGDELEHTNVFQLSGAGNPDLLRSAAIYGPNVVGKSNFVRALEIMRRVVIESATKIQHGDELPMSPFVWTGKRNKLPVNLKPCLLLMVCVFNMALPLPVAE